LLTGKTALSRFAGTKQNILEVFVDSRGGGAFVSALRGVVYTFDSNGKVDPKAFAEIVDIRRRHRAGSSPENVVSIVRTIEQRRWSRANTWRPSRTIVTKIRADVAKPWRQAIVPVLGAG